MNSWDYSSPWPRPWQRRLHVARWMAHLQHRNFIEKESLLDSNGPVVSLTSYGKRIRSVHLTLESIAAGSLRPSRLVLWLEDARVVARPPAALRRLQRRGLEIQGCENIGPHKKYYPYLQSNTSWDQALVTADDDVLYPSFWLSGLVNAHRRAPEAVHCYRAHVAELADSRTPAFLPYERWQACQSTQPSFLNFSTGCSGVIFPAPVLAALKASGRGFLDCCPFADDVWLNLHAQRTGFPVAQVSDVPYRFFGILLTQLSGLFRKNLFHGGNDAALAATYSTPDLHRLATVAQEPAPRSQCA